MGSTTKASIINSIVGPGTLVRGDFEVDGSVRVDGVVRGTLKARGRVVIGENARLQSDVYGTKVIIGGIVKGNVFASEGVSLLSSALILGDIVSPQVKLEEGTFVQGLIMASGSEGNWQDHMKRWQERRSVLSRMGNAPDMGRSNGQG